jgi:hypothetical protein
MSFLKDAVGLWRLTGSCIEVILTQNAKEIRNLHLSPFIFMCKSTWQISIKSATELQMRNFNLKDKEK